MSTDGGGVEGESGEMGRGGKGLGGETRESLWSCCESWQRCRGVSGSMSIKTWSFRVAELLTSFSDVNG